MGFPLATNADRSMSWIGMKWRMRVNDNGVLGVS